MSRRFEPVFLPDERAVTDRVSQTFMRHYNWCPRSAYLYALYKGDAGSIEMERGSAGHAIFERATLAMIDNGEVSCPPELAKAIVNEVLAEYNVPFEEHDYLREMAYRWADDTRIDPSMVISCETLFEYDVAGYVFRAKIDLAWLADAGAECWVRDYKTGRGAPTAEDVSRKRKDGTPAAKAFQLIAYALVLAFGVPVRESIDPMTGERLEVREPFPLADRAQVFHLDYCFPGIKSEGLDGTERMLVRPTTLSRRELEEYRESFEAMIVRLDRSQQAGDWPAQVSDTGCGECPAKPDCPIPMELRDHRGTINTMTEASEAAELVDRRRDRDAAIVKELKAFAKVNGGEIRFGKNKAYRFVESSSVKIKDRPGMFAAMQRAVDVGEDFDRNEWLTDVTSTNFKAVTVAEDEEETDGDG